MRILKNPNVNFMDIRKLGYAISGIVLVISLVSLILHGGPKFGIDFRGGAFLEVRFEDKENPEALLDIPINQVRNIFTARGLGSSEIKHYGSNQDISVQLDSETIQGDGDSTLTNLVTELQSEYPQYNVIERRRESVGPKIGSSGSSSVLGSVRSLLYFMTLL
jgi:preprotein translocase subunit SecF